MLQFDHSYYGYPRKVFTGKSCIDLLFFTEGEQFEISLSCFVLCFLKFHCFVVDCR